MKKIILLLIITLLAACSQSSSVPQASSAPGEQAGSESPDGLPGPLPPGLGRGFTGRLVLVNFYSGGSRLLEIDLASGQTRALFEPPTGSWLGSAQVSPDGRQIVMAYSPPPEDGSIQFGYTSLYLMPSDGSGEPRPFLERQEEGESFFQPAWAPDGNSIYYTHLYPTGNGGAEASFKNDIERVTLEGERLTLLENAIWPAVSPDGSKLAYLTASPGTPDNHLYVAASDGSNPFPVLPLDDRQPVDDHLFLADGSGLIFSMVNPETVALKPTWWERLLGVGIALAHNVPSDWYYAPVEGGKPQRLTELNELGLSGALSPDGKHAAFLSGSGLYIMEIEGAEVFQALKELTVGTVDWVP